MKKIFTILILFTISVFAFGQFGKTGGGKISVKEADGSPAGSNIDTLKVNNGSLTITDNVATINITAAAASSTDSLNMTRATIPADSVMDLTSSQTATGEKTFENIVLPSGCVGTDQVSLNSLTAFDLGPSSVAESEANWAGMDSDSIASRLANKIDSTHIKPGSIHESEMNWGKQDADSAFSSVSAKVATQISDSLGRYTTNSLLDTTKVDTSQWGKFVRDHQVISGGSNDSSWQKVTFVSADGDTNTIQAKNDGTVNIYSEKGIGLRMPKSDATYIFSVGNDISGVDSTFTMDSVGRIGIKMAPNTSYSMSVLNDMQLYNGTYTTELEQGGADGRLNIKTAAGGWGLVYCNSVAIASAYVLEASGFSVSSANYTIGHTTSTSNATYAQKNLNLRLNEVTGVDGQARIGRTGTSGSYTVTDTLGRMAVSKDATHPGFGIDVDDGVRCSDTLYVGDYTTYTYIIPGGDPVKSSDADLKHNFTPLDSLLKPWELFGKAEGLEIYRFQYDSAKVYEKTKFDSTVYSWWNEKPADSLSLGQKDSVSAELAKRKADTKKNWENERKEFASKVSRPTHTGPTEQDWNLFMFADSQKKGVNSGDVMWAQMALIKKLIAEVKRLDGVTKDLETRVSKLEGK